MRGGAVHILTCETHTVAPGPGPESRAAALGREPAIQMSPNTSYLRSLAAYAPEPRLVRANACIGYKWDGFFTKAKAILAYLASGRAAPHDLVLFSDSDVLWNAPVPVAEVHRRFEAALEDNGPSCRVVFQAEAWCVSPWREANGAVHLSCAEDVGAGYAERGFGLDPLCHGLLNSGGVIGRAVDLEPVYRQWTAPAAEWPPLPTSHPRRRAGPNEQGPASCALEAGGDQCLAAHLLLRSNGTVGVDVRERIFATAAVALWRNGSRTPTPMKYPWPSRSGRVSCGSAPSMRCGGSSSLQWQRSAESGVLERPRWYQELCNLASAGPLVIHFNGPVKHLAKDAFGKLIGLGLV